MARQQKTTSLRKTIASALKHCKQVIRTDCFKRFQASCRTISVEGRNDIREIRRIFNMARMQSTSSLKKSVGSVSKKWKETIRKAVLHKLIAACRSISPELQLRHIVEEQMFQHVMNVVSERVETASIINLPNANHYITEEELYGLLQQVDEELQHNRLEALLEEMMDIATLQLNEQVADFELWEQSNRQSSNNSSGDFS
jgi:Ca2+-binding EF-hand superfamily protein